MLWSLLVSRLRLLTYLLPLTLVACVLARVEFAEIVQLRPNLNHGSELYEGCVACHEPVSGKRDSRVPRLDGQHFTVLVKELVDYRRGNRWSDAMEAEADPHDLDRQSVADVAAYASQEVRPRSPAWTRPDSVEPGALIYTSRCQSCHGVDGVGNAVAAIPKIGGQHYGYLAWQLFDVVNGHRLNMPEHHRKALRKLDVDSILDVADFLSRSTPEERQ